jgi:hypothetical protein
MDVRGGEVYRVALRSRGAGARPISDFQMRYYIR